MPNRTTLTIAIVACLLVGLTLAWRFTGLAEAAKPEQVRGFLAEHAHGPWELARVLAAFFLGSVIAFPVTILILATAATFGPVKGALYSLLGVAISAPLMYWIGARFGQDAVARLLGPRWEPIRDRLRNRGVLALVAIRILPLAPYSLINLAAGASSIRPVDFVLGTFLGMLPGLVVLSVLGDRIVAILLDPSLGQLGLLALSVAAWLGLSFGAQLLISRLTRRGR